MPVAIWDSITGGAVGYDEQGRLARTLPGGEWEVLEGE